MLSTPRICLSVNFNAYDKVSSLHFTQDADLMNCYATGPKPTPRLCYHDWSSKTGPAPKSRIFPLIVPAGIVEPA